MNNSSPSTDSPRQKLEEYPLGKTLLTISRRFEESSIRGYILDIGPTFFLLALVTDRIWFDSFECFRIEDVLEVSPDSNAGFVETALAKRGEVLPFKPRIDLGGIQELLTTSSQLFPLVAIHREHARPDSCWIGRVTGVNQEHVSLIEINPDASWDHEPIEHPIQDITRVNFGGDYEDALALVGGEAPELPITPANT